MAVIMCIIIAIAVLSVIAIDAFLGKQNKKIEENFTVKYNAWRKTRDE